MNNALIIKYFISFYELLAWERKDYENERKIARFLLIKAAQIISL